MRIVPCPESKDDIPIGTYYGKLLRQGQHFSAHELYLRRVDVHEHITSDSSGQHYILRHVNALLNIVPAFKYDECHADMSVRYQFEFTLEDLVAMQSSLKDLIIGVHEYRSEVGDNRIYRFRRVCTNCDHVSQSENSTSFMDPHFDPEVCPSCGEEPKQFYQTEKGYLSHTPSTRPWWKDLLLPPETEWTTVSIIARPKWYRHR